MANLFKSSGTQAVGVTKVTAYTAPALTTSTIIGLSIANILPSTTIYVDVKISKSAVETFIVKAAPIVPGGSLVVVGGDQKVVLETTDMIKIQSTSAASADVLISVLEVS
jgi:hypothetical protein